MLHNEIKTLDIQTLADSFGTTTEDIPEECINLLNKMDREYMVLGHDEREKLIVDVLKKIDSDKQIIGAPERTKQWHLGWEENLIQLRESDYDLKNVLPKFIKKNKPIRFMGNYIIPKEPHFEHLYYNVFRAWLFDKYFSSFDSVYDIGCGSSYNLVELCSRFPEKKIHGFDFVQSSVDIVNELAKKYDFNTKGQLFNIIEPNFDINLDENSLVFTSGVIEQVASKFDKFIDFLLKKKPSLVINIEPTYEVYNQNQLFDYLAARFHQKRGYTKGYLPKLRELESENKIKILKTKRLNFGSLFMEGFTYIIWKPI